MILGTLSAIIVPTYMDHELKAKASTMAQNIHSIRSWLKAYYAEHGSYPVTLDPDVFEPPLENIWGNDANSQQIWHSNLPLNVYPSNKTFDDGAANSMWYNRSNGSFCARVPPQGSTAENLALFNRVNATSVTGMSQTQ